MKSVLKRMAAVFVILAMLLPLCAIAQDGANSVKIRFAAYDGTTGTFLFVPQELTVSEGIAEENGFENAQPGHTVGGVDHGVQSGEISALDALVAAHIAADGNTDSIIGSSSYVMGMFGVEGYISFSIDGKVPIGEFSDGYAMNEYVLSDGETVLFYIYGDMYCGDYASYFNENELSVKPGEEFTMNLEGYSPLDLMWSNPGDPTAEPMTQVIPHATVYTINKQTGTLKSTGISTDENGDFTYSFNEAGEYILTAQATVRGMYGNVPIVAPICFITVKEEKKTYDVTVKTAESDINVKFYNASDEEVAATKSSTDDGYCIYTLKLEEGTYYYRAADNSGNSLGGMSFDVYGNREISLRRVNIYAATKIDNAYANAQQYTVEVIDPNGEKVASGTPYVSTYTFYPFVLIAGGNSILYTLKAIPSDESYNLGVNTVNNYTVDAGTTAVNKRLTLPAIVETVITAPKESRVQVFNQIKNFNNEEVSYAKAEESGDTVSYTYRLPKSSGSYTYRASMDGKITKAGYLKLTSADTAKTDIIFAENENPKIRPQYDTTTPLGAQAEDSILLNINRSNYLRLKSGETFKARAYRARQIINSDTGNIMIEPDFEYKIIQGDSITLEQQGQNAVLKAVKKGVSIVEVTYDAIEITGTSKGDYDGIYGAIDPARKGLFIVNVDGNTESEITLPSWDSDLDTAYFMGESGTLDFEIEADASFAVSCNGEAVERSSGGIYRLPIKNGNNIVCVEAGETDEYIIIKGKKVTVNINNETSPGQPLKQGDKVSISFTGLHMPVPKVSGIYNPGYGQTVKVRYTNAKGDALTSTGAQYNFINNHTISFQVYDKGTVELTNGTIPMTVMGFAPGAHREITDKGINTNFTAEEISCEFSRLPDISFEVMENEELKSNGIIGKSITCDGENVEITLISIKDTAIDIYVKASDENGRITKVKRERKQITVGENTLYISIADFDEKQKLSLYVWDKNLTPVFNDTNI